MMKTAEQFGLVSSLNPRGRPKVAIDSRPFFSSSSVDLRLATLFT